MNIDDMQYNTHTHQSDPTQQSKCKYTKTNPAQIQNKDNNNTHIKHHKPNHIIQHTQFIINANDNDIVY